MTPEIPTIALINHSGPRVKVRFLKKCPPYNAGEIAGFKEDSPILKTLLKEEAIELIEPQTHSE